ncbi:MAG: Daple [Actinoplanes sp.]
MTEIPPSGESYGAERWAESRSRYSDLLSSRTPAQRTEPAGTQLAEPGLGTGERPTSLRSFDVPTPNSAPPYPYEGDLDETPSAGQQRAAVPLVRPATPGGGRWGQSETDSARHALGPAATTQSMPRVEVAEEARPARPSYDPSSFPRRLPTDQPAPAAESSGYVPPAPYAAFNRGAGANDPRPADQGSRVLPQRVPAQPDVPRVPEPLVEPTAETPALARIATALRRGDVRPVQERQEGFDVQAILAAVREVDGVRDASLRSTPTGAHSLRLDLAEGADPAEVSRQVARLLQDRMGLDAAMPGESPLAGRMPAPPTPEPAPPAPVSPSALVPSARPVSPSPAPASAPPVAPTQPQAQAPTAAAAPPAPVAAPAPRAAEREPDTAAVEPTDVDYGPPRPLFPGEQPGPRIIIENVHVNTFGTEATVSVRLSVGSRTASGEATGPAVDGYLMRLCAMATAGAVDDLLANSDHPEGPARCFVEHAAAVPFGPSQVAVVVLLLSWGGWVEQLAGSAVVTGDERNAMVRATLAAVNRRLEALLSR